MGRADLLFTFADENKVDGELLPCRLEGMKRTEKGSFRAFLVDGAATNAGFAQTSLFDETSFERRRRPLGGIELFHVVHEVDADPCGRAGVEETEDTGLARG